MLNVMLRERLPTGSIEKVLRLAKNSSCVLIAKMAPDYGTGTDSKRYRSQCTVQSYRVSVGHCRSHGTH